MNNKLPMLMDYYPSIPRTELTQHCKYKIDLSEAKKLNGGLAVIATTVAEAMLEPSKMEGCYRCVFPDGVTGTLAKFKAEDAFTGTIMGVAGIVGQARWIPIEGESLLLAADPVMIAVGVALSGINKQLDEIKTTQKEIIEFLQMDKESKLEGAINSLASIYEEYAYNSNDSSWKTSQLTVVTTLKGRAEDSIGFYRKQIQKILDEQKLIHSNQNAEKILNKLQYAFEYYSTSLCLYSYASFMEVVLGNNKSADYLNHKADIIKEYSYQYKLDYTNCYNQLDEYANDSVHKKIMEGIGIFSKFTGEAVAKIPVLNKGLVDEALVSAGKKLDELSYKHVDGILDDFREHKDTGTQLFVESIEKINDICNNNVEVVIDNNVIYLCG